jgi:hypothetical protein
VPQLQLFCTAARGVYDRDMCCDSCHSLGGGVGWNGLLGVELKRVRRLTVGCYRQLWPAVTAVSGTQGQRVGGVASDVLFGWCLVCFSDFSIVLLAAGLMHCTEAESLYH